MLQRLLTSGSILLIVLMGCLSACGASVSTTVATNSSVPTLTPSLIPTVTTKATPSATPKALVNCADLSPMTTILQQKQGHVSFSMSITPNLVFKGTITGYTLADYTITGSGYTVGPNNDPVQILVNRGTKFDNVVITDMTQGKKTTYISYGCSFKTASDIVFIGSDPAVFSLDFLLTP